MLLYNSKKMPKEPTCITLDTNIKSKAKRLGIEISSFCNNVLAGVIAKYEGKDVDVFALREELQVIEKKMSDLAAKKQEIVTTLNIVEEKEKEAEKKERKRLERIADGVHASGIMRNLGK